MSNGICISWENLNTSINELKIKIDSIEKCYNDMNNLYKELDGSTPTWVGDNQRQFYQSYCDLSSAFPENVEKFKEFYNFLCMVRDTYKESDSTNKANIDNKIEDLMA